MDQFLLPRLRLESVSIHSLAFIHNTHPEIVKLPFPLTLGFKSMLQRGVETPDMDVRWVSSLSWYFLNFFGLNGLYRIILGSDNGKFNILDCSLCVVVVVGTILTACWSRRFITRHVFPIRCCSCSRSSTRATAGLQQAVQSRERQPGVFRRAILLGCKRRGDSNTEEIRKKALALD